MNKIYKKIISFSIITGMLFSICGCGTSAADVQSEGMKKVGSLNVEEEVTYTDDSEKEEVIETFSSADGLCVIEKYPTYYDVTLDYEKGEPAEVGKAYAERGLVMQLHIGTYLDANTKGVREVGQSTGFDCTDDQCSVTSVGELLNRLTLAGELPKTILYPLDGTKIETWAVLAAGFCDNDTRSKVQLGAPWWFNDQQFGIERQFEACANLYPVSLSVGMLTDSRSFISYPRHELYRRVFCNYLGTLCERGEYFGSEKNLQEIIEDVCFNNVNNFFEFHVTR